MEDTIVSILAIVRTIQTRSVFLGMVLLSVKVIDCNPLNGVSGRGHFWNYDRWEKDFDNFVFSNGGIVNPWQNSPPKSFENDSFKTISKILKFSPFWGSENFFSFHKRSRNPEGIMLNNVKQMGRNPKFRKFLEDFPEKGRAGCEDGRGFHFEGETWYSRGCKRHKCLHFRGRYFVESDSCDTEIYNTTYKCINEADLEANYPNCCPKYNCNPDNLGNRVNVIGDFFIK